LSSSKHVIICARMKQQHEQVEENGRKVVRKLGMGIQQDDNLEYEVNVAIEMDMAHTMFVSKSRTRAVPVGTEFHSGHAERFAGIYREWLSAGEPTITKEQRSALVDVLNRITDAPTRQQAKDDFLSVFGRPEFILESRFAEATKWVANKLLGVDETPDRAEGDVPPDDTPKDDETHEHGEDPPTPAPEAKTDEHGTEAELRRGIEADVERMDLAAVRAALKNDYKLAANGSAKALRKKLVDARVKASNTPI